MKVFSVKDTKANYYTPPQLYRNSQEAVRAVTNSVNGSGETLFAKNSEDFALFEIGSFDETAGKIEGCEKRHICDLIDLRTEDK